ncbi:MAG: HAD hydrolase family protein [Chloroflexota bacterium]|nr:HAD hydrolase family protein [Chloroflexota bacterium]
MSGEAEALLPQRSHPHQVRPVASDIDGTLLRPDGTVSDYTRRILGRVSDVVPLVLVTARPPPTACTLAAEIGVSGLIVCANGALVYDSAQRSLVAQHLIPADDAAALVRAIRAAVPGACFAFEFPTKYGWEPRYRDLKRRLLGAILPGSWSSLAGATPARS